MTIQTYKNVPLDVSEHPYCKAFWKMGAAVSVGGKLPCAVSPANDMTIVFGGLTANANGISLDAVTSGGGSWAGMDVSGKDVIFAYCGKVKGGVSSAVAVGRGAISGTGFYIPAHNNAVVTNNQAVGDAGTGATDRISNDSLHNVYFAHEVGGNSNSSIDGTLDSVGIPLASSVGDIVIDTPVLLGGTEMYGMAIFTFAAGTLPANYEGVMAWMFNEWRNGRKVLPPMWRGIE